MKTRNIDIKGMSIEIYDDEKACDQTIVFAHGLGGNIRQWEKQLKAFPDFRVIAFSLQGHGRSSKQLNTDDLSIASYGDVAVEVLKELAVDTCIWVGNSMGGVIGYEVLSRNQNLINLLITNGTTPVLKMPAFQLKMMKFADRLLIKMMRFNGYIKFAANHSTKYDQTKQAVYNMFSETTPDVIVSSHQILGDYDYTRTIQNTSTPIAIIHSPDDKGINGYLKKLSSNLPLKHYDLPHSGHVANMEIPEAYNLLVHRIIIENI